LIWVSNAGNEERYGNGRGKSVQDYVRQLRARLSAGLRKIRLDPDFASSEGHCIDKKV
jgi:hypothetical protein